MFGKGWFSRAPKDYGGYSVEFRGAALLEYRDAEGSVFVGMERAGDPGVDVLVYLEQMYLDKDIASPVVDAQRRALVENRVRAAFAVDKFIVDYGD